MGMDPKDLKDKIENGGLREILENQGIDVIELLK